MWECDYLAFVKAFDSVVSQGNKELSGSANVKGQSSAGLSCLLNKLKSGQRYESMMSDHEQEMLGGCVGIRNNHIYYGPLSKCPTTQYLIILFSQTYFCWYQTDRCFHGDLLQGRCLLRCQRPHGGNALSCAAEQCGPPSPTNWGRKTVHLKIRPGV